MTVYRRAMMMASLLGAIAACTAPPPHPPPAPPAQPPATDAAPVPRPRPDPAAKPSPFRPEQLTGLSRAEVLILLGSPLEAATQSMATVWRYRQGNCGLSLLFYPEVESSVERVLGYEFTGGGDAAACLDRLRTSGGRHGQ